MKKNFFLLLVLAIISFDVKAIEGIQVIVNVQNDLSSLSADEVRDFFLKKNKQWPNGSAVRFFDRNDGSQERGLFLKQILKQSARDVEIFWIGQKLYTGHSSPTQITSDSMTASLVGRFSGAIGYVSETFQLPPEVKKIEVKGF